MTTLADDVELYGCMAEFVTPEELVEAARRTRAAGYQQVEAYSPFPVHGINEALGLRPSWIPRLALIGGCAEPSPPCCWSITARRSLIR